MGLHIWMHESRELKQKNLIQGALKYCSTSTARGNLFSIAIPIHAKDIWEHRNQSAGDSDHENGVVKKYRTGAELKVSKSGTIRHGVQLQ